MHEGNQLIEKVIDPITLRAEFAHVNRLIDAICSVRFFS